jgi:hypothetical protein
VTNKPIAQKIAIAVRPESLAATSQDHDADFLARSSYKLDMSIPEVRSRPEYVFVWFFGCGM